MDITVLAFLGLLAAVALLRIFELGVSRRNQQRLIAHGATKISKPNFRWVVLVHVAVLLGAALEVLIFRRPFYPLLAGVMSIVFIASNAVRLWVVRSMGEHWNVQVMDSVSLGVVTTGPFRFVRHPNYAAVFLEMFSLPLIHTAWVTAFVACMGYAIVISQRISVEESVLLANPDYRAAMGAKPRFLPGLF
jgi:methyltransferase